MADKSEFERLPKHVVPIFYTVHIAPCLKSSTFSGDEDIELEIKQNSDRIVIHCIDIEIKHASISANGEHENAAKVEFDMENESATIFFTKNYIGKAVLHLKFSGVLNDKLKGFYRTKYHDVNGVEKNSAVTQFEATDARRCFPCFDEPNIKAQFKCSLTIPKELLGLCNTPVESEVAVSDTHKRVNFEAMPKSSTYLVAFYVGEADFVEQFTRDNVCVRVYTPPGKREHGRLALDLTVNCVHYYEDYFQTKFPLPKMDLIALEDFCCEAMENWGLITFRDSAILVDPESCSADRKLWVALTVAHEVAHQWFGNLVTMDWWTHLWLNEGFATFMEYLSVDAIHPDWKVFRNFLKDDWSHAIQLDALSSSHPVEVEVNHPDEVDEIFDAISYKKGASIIRMLYFWIGAESFQKGMGLYFKNNAYGNTLTDDLWAPLAEASGMPVKQVMKGWVEQLGFPLVTVERISKTKIKISQQKCNAAKNCGEGGTLWSIPVTISSSNSPDKPIVTKVLRTMEEVWESSDFDADWIKLNCQSVGFYRVRYGPSLANQFKEISHFAVADRLQLQNDLFALCMGGYCPLTDYIDFIDALYANETEYSILADIMKNLGDFGSLLWNMPEAVQKKFSSWKLKFFTPIMGELGLEAVDGEHQSRGQLRGVVMQALGGLGDDRVVDFAHGAYTQYLTKSAAIDADLKVPVFQTVLMHPKGKPILKELLHLWETETDLSIEKCLGAIAGRPNTTENQAELEIVMKFLDEKVKMGNLYWTIHVIAGSSAHGLKRSWEWIKSKTADFRTDRYPGRQRRELAVKPLEGFACKESKLEIEQYFKDGTIPETERFFDQTMERIGVRAACVERETDGLVKFFGL